MTRVICIRAAPLGWKTNPKYVYVGRAGNGLDGYFGNPFRIGPDGDRTVVLAKFQARCLEKIAADSEYRRRVVSLRGKTLVCFCAPKPCHGDVLAKIAETLQGDLEGDER